MRLLAGLALALTLAATAARAQEPEAPRARLFLSPMGEPFRQGGAAAWFARADADGDEALTLAEFQADGLRLFRRLDANGDDLLDGFELQAYERDIAPEITGFFYTGGDAAARAASLERRPRIGFRPRGAESRKGPYAAREGAGRFSLLNIPQPVMAADTDADRRVTLAEWNRAAALRFGLLDKDGAGVLTLAGLIPPADPPARRP